MKVNKIDVVILPKQNTHKKYLFNDVLDVVRTEKLSCEFNPNYIKLYNISDRVLEILNKLNIELSKGGNK